MKILYLTDQIYLHGGVEKVLSQKANYLADIMGDEVTIATYRQQNNIPVYTINPKINLIDLHVNYEIDKSYFHPDNLKKIPQHLSSLKVLIKKLEPDIIISSNFGPDFYFLPYLEKQVPKVKEFHSSRYFYRTNQKTLKSKMLSRWNTFIEKKYNRLVVLNDGEREFYPNQKLSVIPNPAQTTTIRANLASKIVMAAGRISPVKNFGDIIESFFRLSKQFPDWELYFFGEDYLGTQKELQKKIEILGLEKQIKFKGTVDDLKNEMQYYSIYAMTSITECFPMVLLESLSVGLPVISYDAPTGPKYILKNGEDSFLVPYKNLDIFTQTLKELMQNENLRKEMSDKGIENVQRFSIENVMQQWKNLFDSLV